jgi:hypothetical protein
VREDQALSCPSAQPGMRNLRVLGVAERTPAGARVIYLNEMVDADAAILGSTGEVHPTEVLRLAGDCESSSCVHFSGGLCHLAGRVTRGLPAVVDVLPVCMIRASCRWFHQEGRDACLRCPQVVTECADASDEYRQVAAPRSASLD